MAKGTAKKTKTRPVAAKKKKAGKAVTAAKRVAGKVTAKFKPKTAGKQLTGKGKSRPKTKTAGKKPRPGRQAPKKGPGAKAKTKSKAKPKVKPKPSARKAAKARAKPKPKLKTKPKPKLKAKLKPGGKGEPKPKPTLKTPKAKPKAKAAGTKAKARAGKEQARPAPAAPQATSVSAPPRLAPKAPEKPAFDVAGYLQELDRLGVHPGLARVQKLLKALGSPEKKLKIIHVVGTNGKSSTARMLAAILQAQGVKTGLYLSPHLVSFNERFIINGREISDHQFEKLLQAVKQKAEEVNKRSRSSGPLTQFEILTAAAFFYFAQQKVGAAVVEAGLGGRYDATNAADSRIQVMTNIALEHTELLGETVAEIVREKAAVIPEKGNVVLGALSEEAMKEAMKICRRHHAKVLAFGEDFSVLKGRGDLFDVWAARGRYSDLRMTLFGNYQRTNCAVAIQAAELFLRNPLDEKKLRRVVMRTTIPGRLEVISEKPTVILDGAHNPNGVEELLASLEPMVNGKRIICVVSILKDKDASAMLKRLLEFCDILFITENSNPRCASAQDLSKLPEVTESHVQTFVARENQSALESAFKLASIRDVILVTGSLYLLADIKKRIGY